MENKAIGRERPPLGSEETIGKVVDAILSLRRDNWDALRKSEPRDWAYRLHDGGYLNFKPHYLEIVEAFRVLGWVRVSGPLTGTQEDLHNPDIRKTRPEDMFKAYVAGVRRREMEQRREISARRRRDAEKLGLSPAESDRAEERREELRRELAALGLGDFRLPWPPSPPRDWEPGEAALAEGQRRYESYLSRRIRWHFERPDIHPPLRSHNGRELIHDFAWDAERGRRAAKIREKLRELGDEEG